jgi:hypothetical protein
MVHKIIETRTLGYTDLSTGEKRAIGQIIVMENEQRKVLPVTGRTEPGELPGTGSLTDNLFFANAIARMNNCPVRTFVDLDQLEKYRQAKGINHRFDLVRLYDLNVG